MIDRGDRAVGHLLDALAHDVVGLAHLLHADEIAVVIVAVLADGNLEFEFVVALVRLRAPQVPRHAGRSQHRAAHAPSFGVGAIDFADIHIALLEDAILGQQRFDIVQHFRKSVR